MEQLPDAIREKYERLLEIVGAMGSVLVAFSGGLDSGMVVFAALKALGEENLWVVTGDSESLAGDEMAAARRFVEGLGIAGRQVIVRTEELSDHRYAANPEDRCFYCKQELYGKLRALADSRGARYVLDGCNASDVGDHRPGRRAAEGFGVRSPLLEAGLDKEEIRAIARFEGLEIWDKPQSACLASRIPYGERVTAEKLSMVERAERYLRTQGFKQVRVRHHGELARIEIPEEDIGRMLEPRLRQAVRSALREIGFLWVSLDLKGFESGSMNVMLQPAPAGQSSG